VDVRRACRDTAERLARLCVPPPSRHRPRKLDEEEEGRIPRTLKALEAWLESGRCWWSDQDGSPPIRTAEDVARHLLLAFPSARSHGQHDALTGEIKDARIGVVEHNHKVKVQANELLGKFLGVSPSLLRPSYLRRAGRRKTP
jgi:hypothetical protein